MAWLRNTYHGTGVRQVVTGASTSITRRFATAAAVALVLFITALPAAAACCLGKPNRKAVSMHALMPCCAGTCNLTTPNTNRDRDISLTSTHSPEQPLQVMAGADALGSKPIKTALDDSSERTVDRVAAPPPFLLHGQFRI
jgi:hypothetical protein